MGKKREKSQEKIMTSHGLIAQHAAGNNATISHPATLKLTNSLPHSTLKLGHI